MSRRVFLHVGLPKSGTSYVQRLLTANKRELKQRAGLLFPGRAWHQQVLAVRDVRDMGRRRVSSGAWDRLRQEISDWPGDAVISMEWLCAADDAHARRVVEGLAPADVEVVFTVRDLGRTLPAAWQEYLQNRYDWPWEEFLSGVFADDPTTSTAGGAFWSQQDAGGLVRRWSAVAGSAHTHVVTLPHPGTPPKVLWERMAEVFGIDPEGYTTEGLVGNESLGLESAEVLRRLNPLTRAVGMRRPGYHQVIKHDLAKRILADRKPVESRLAIPAGYHGAVRAAADRHVAEIEASGVRVVGDLGELDPVLTEGRQPEDLPDSALLEASLAGVLALAREGEKLRRKDLRTQRRTARLQARLARSRRRVGALERRVQRLERRAREFEARPVRSGIRIALRSLRRRLAAR